MYPLSLISSLSIKTTFALVRTSWSTFTELWVTPHVYPLSQSSRASGYPSNLRKKSTIWDVAYGCRSLGFTVVSERIKTSRIKGMCIWPRHPRSPLNSSVSCSNAPYIAYMHTCWFTAPNWININLAVYVRACSGMSTLLVSRIFIGPGFDLYPFS